MSKFNELPISDEIIRAVSEMGYEEATPIQASAIPAILEGHDRNRENSSLRYSCD